MMKIIFDILILLSFLSCLEGAKSFVIQPQTWDFKGHNIGWEVARRVYKNDELNGTHIISSDSSQSEKEPILLLNGFGVGSFHQHRLISELLEEGYDSRVIYCMDYLGQGRSWPKDCEDGFSNNEKGLIYSAGTWHEQVIQFIETVVKEVHPNKKVHLVGNSVGGYLAAYVAYYRPDLIQSVCLLNPTPVWGLNLPGWSGHLPPPNIPKAIGRYLFDKIRDLGTIKAYLEGLYSRTEAFNEELINQIRDCTMGNGGHAAFASIMWSPPLKVMEDKSFQKCLNGIDCDVLLVYGKDDPCCRPAFAKKQLQVLKERKNSKIQRYVEVENCGHCPNHEAPQATGHMIRSWVDAEDRRKGFLKLVMGNTEKQVFHEPWGEIVIQELEEEDIQLSFLDFLAVTFV